VDCFQTGLVSTVPAASACPSPARTCAVASRAWGCLPGRTASWLDRTECSGGARLRPYPPGGEVTSPCKLDNARQQQSVPQGHAQLAARAASAGRPQAEVWRSAYRAEPVCRARQGPRTRK